jgi:hypothetical protein
MRWPRLTSSPVARLPAHDGARAALGHRLADSDMMAGDVLVWLRVIEWEGPMSTCLCAVVEKHGSVLLA